MFDKKQKFDTSLLPKDIFEKIKSVNEHEEMMAAGRKLAEFKTQLASANAELEAFYQGPSSEGIQHSNAENDGASLLAGTKLEDLPGQVTATARQNLVRKIHALDSAIVQQLNFIQTLESRLIREGLEPIEPLAIDLEKDVLDKFENLLKSLQVMEQFYDLLQIKGYKKGLRLGHWALMPLEKSLLFGSPDRPSLQFFIDERRKYWEL